MASYKLLTTGNPKLMKGQKKGYLSFVLHLAPSDLSGYNTCPMASLGCRAACLNTAGRGGIFKPGENTNTIQAARIRKTRLFFENRSEFMRLLVKDIQSAIREAEEKGYIPVFRLNGTSDIRWETVATETHTNVMEQFPNIQFYDYTKLQNRKNLPKNYHLTFSRSESNDNILNTIAHNIAVVFSTKKGQALPKKWNGRKVVDGDDTDLRFLDGKKVIVGLRAKGKARNGTFDSFVVTV